MTETEKFLFEKYGPLLTLAQLAKILDRSEEGLRLTLRNHSPLARQLTSARLKIGRRVHFRTHEIASILDLGMY
jgi:hypothetical protein